MIYKISYLVRILPDTLIPLLHLVRSFELQNNYRSDKFMINPKRNSKRSNLTQEPNQIFNSQVTKKCSNLKILDHQTDLRSKNYRKQLEKTNTSSTINLILAPKAKRFYYEAPMSEYGKKYNFFFKKKIRQSYNKTFQKYQFSLSTLSFNLLSRAKSVNNLASRY